MLNVKRPLPFVMISTNHGTMIVNRNDYRTIDGKGTYGVGHQLLNTSSYEQQEVNFALGLIEKRRQSCGAGVVAIDCGANIGVHTIEWARMMYGWGRVIAFEAQEKIYYALAGNVAINNCLNVTAKHCAVGAECSTIKVPELNYLLPSSYGSFELKEREKNEFIGQTVDYKKTTVVDLLSIDSLNLERIDFIKIDVEGMEEDVLKGADVSIRKCLPIMLIEVIKSNKAEIESLLKGMGYQLYPTGVSILAVHASDPVSKLISFENNVLRLN